MTMQGKTVLITGGNTGIGKATAVELARKGAAVTITSRDPAKGEAAVADIRRESGSDAVDVMRLDLASLAEVRRFAGEYLAARPRLDVLINNAGLILTDRSETVDGFETTFGVNHLGPFLLTHLLLDRLKASAPARIVVLSSDAHRGAGGLDFDDLQARRSYRGLQVYCRSKLANALFTLELAERLRGTGVTVNAVHPGVVATELTRDFPKLFMKLSQLFLLTPEQGAACSLHVATAPELDGVTGEYFEKSRIKPAAAAALDEAAQERLWKLTEALVA